jgi:hypothetical protein
LHMSFPEPTVDIDEIRTKYHAIANHTGDSQSESA